MNKNVMRQAGFKKEMEAVDRGVCPLCENEITEFRDRLSLKEFEISGMCQSCQDDIFGY